MSRDLQAIVGNRRKHLLIDLDGVIRLWDVNDALVLPIPIAEIWAAAFERSLLTQVVTGVITDEEWRCEVVRRLSVRYDQNESRQCVEIWSASPGRVNKAVLDILEASPFAENLCLVTNGTSRLNQDLAALGLERRFKTVINSSVVGAAKPDERIFLAALNAARCSAADAVFVDDSPANVSAASALGIGSHLYRGPDNLREFLRCSDSRACAAG